MISKIKTIFLVGTKYLCIKLFWLFPIKKNKIVMSSYRGRSYSDNPRFISEALENNSELDIVWIVNDGICISEKCRSVKTGSIRSYYEIATAKVWVDNCRKDIWISKRNNQYYIQTWHANLSGKKVEGDAEKALRRSYIIGAKKDSEMADLFISGSRWETDLYRRAFFYNGEIMECGMPRTDIFYKENSCINKKVRKDLGLENQRIVLYAPTFRQDRRTDCYDMDYSMVIEELEKNKGGEWVLVVRLHPNIANLHDFIKYDAKIINGSYYQDINEIIISADLLITDYSSCMFEAIEAKTPVIIYASDTLEYNSERGSYISQNELPFPVCKNNKELQLALQSYDTSKYKRQALEFLKKYGVVQQGNSSEIVANRILSVIKQEEGVL